MSRRFLFAVLLACLGMVRGSAEDPKAPGWREYLAVNQTPPRICLISITGTVSVAADMPSVRLRQIGVDGRTYQIRRSYGDLVSCQISPDRVASPEGLRVLHVAGEWMSRPIEALVPSQDGRYIALIAHTDPSYVMQELFLLDLLEKKLTRLTSFQSKTGAAPLLPRWSPNGRFIAFYQIADSSAVDYHSTRLALYVAAIDGEVKRLADESHIAIIGGADPYVGPVWSSDSQTVFFVGHMASEPVETPRGYPVTYSASVSDGTIRRIGPGNPWSTTPDGTYLFCSAPGSPDDPSRVLSRRVTLRTGEYAEMSAEMQRIRVSPSGRYLASFLGHTIIIFTIDGEEKARIDMDQHELLKPGTGIVSWVAFK